ncbi:MAG: GNAT family N-acetyltransferase [Pseudomonadota bacterium]|nr:GNAT family N-acetyltransferase [Pseudomonadota bacterium]
MPTPLQLLRSRLRQTQHRALVVLSGSADWQQRQLDCVWQSNESILWAGSVPTVFANQVQSIKESQYKHLLGQEVDSVVLDIQSGFSANGLGILSGLIRAGGLLVVLTPDSANWTGLPNPENHRFLNTPYTPDNALPFFSEHLHQNFEEQAICFSQQQSAAETRQHLDTYLANTPNTSPQQTLPTLDQQQALQQIDKVAFGHRKRPLVISADRGRGKTSALGLAAIQLLLQGKQHIVLTASRYDQAKMAFKQACSVLKNDNSDIEIEKNKSGLLTFKWQNQLKTFEFVAPDQLIIQPTQADVLMVDEAAHLPTPLLTELLKRHHRMVFATTLHGYEGSGRGFELRFKKTLNQLTPDWKQLHLKTPIRWAEDDPLERLINHALLLDENLSPIEQACLELPASDLQIKTLSTAELAKNTAELRSLFNLLVQAHYQTSPNDLQQLLCAPNIKLFVAYQAQQPVGVVLAVEEGKIATQSERLHGHLVPQLLKNHYTQPSFLMLSTWRIMRIAVHPQLQNRGIGKQLITFVKQQAKQARVDYLSSSFGATNDLLPFWLQQNFIPLHVGVKRDKSSGSHTVVVCQSLTPMAQQALAAIQREFQQQFPHVLMESLPYFSASMVLEILKTFRFKKQQPHLQEALVRYQNSERVYESISGQLWEWSIRNPLALSQVSSNQQAVWCDKVLKKRPWQEVAHSHHLAGRKGVEKNLQQTVSQVIKNPSKAISPYARVPKAY